MIRLQFFFALLCCFALSGFVLGNSATKEGIDALDHGIDAYGKILDKVVPWSKLNEITEKVGQHGSDYSKQAAALIGDIKTKMLYGMAAYKKAVQNIYEWCRLSADLLSDYSELMSGETDQATLDDAQSFLLEVFSYAITKMTAAQAALGDSSSNFKSATEELTKLNQQLKTDFDHNSDNNKKAIAAPAAAPVLGNAIAVSGVEGKLNNNMASIMTWYKQITGNIQRSIKTIDDTKAKLQEEIKRIGDVKAQIESTTANKDNAALEATILKSIENLIAKCNAFQKRHHGGK